MKALDTLKQKIKSFVFELHYPGMVRVCDIETLRAFKNRNVTIHNPHAGKSGRDFRAMVTGQEKDGGILLALHGASARWMYINQAMLDNGWECFAMKRGEGNE